jgi:hypothetical protein
MRYLLAAMLVILSGCVPRAQLRQGDLLDEIAKRPPREFRKGKDGEVIRPKHQLFEIDKAVAALADVPRPWTVEKMTDLYAYGNDPKRKAHILWILAASCDSRAALVLGHALNHSELDVRIAAVYGLMSFFSGGPYSGGTDSHGFTVQRWLEKNRQRLVTEARKLIKENAGPGGVSTSSFLWQLTLPPKEEITFRGRPIRFRDPFSTVMTWEVTFKRSDGSFVKGLFHGSKNEFFSVMGLMDYDQIQSVRDYSRFPVFHIRGKCSDVVPDAWDVVLWGIPRSK